MFGAAEWSCADDLCGPLTYVINVKDQTTAKHMRPHVLRGSLFLHYIDDNRNDYLLHALELFTARYSRMASNASFHTPELLLD